MIALLLFALAAKAAFISFDNCLPNSTINSNPQQLQFVPLFFDANFNSTADGHQLVLTVYGNVTGRQFEGELPPSSNISYWQNANETNGKITDVGSSGEKYSTLYSRYSLLSYNAYEAPASRFCLSVENGSCPVAPVFENVSEPWGLPTFSVNHTFQSNYHFGTLASTLRVVSGDSGAQDLACISANVTPDLGSNIGGLLTWLPAAILILKGVATLAAAIYSPWGSSDIFRWSSNYGRDEDLLRLVTPGFGDCLQYIQFVVLTGSLSLQYPGYFQPAVSQASWSLLLFNESFVTRDNGTQSLIDGIYTTNGSYGMQRMSELVGMSTVDDVWACMAIWLLVIAAIVVVLCQLGFVGRWVYRRFTDTSEEDLRAKNLPFTIGNLIRLLFNFFILPVVALSLFQLVVASRSTISVVVCAVILLVIMILAAGWILRVIFSTKPRTYLFDDMPTVLLYGPLYNTYSDSAAPFALVPVFITFMRGVAIGAVQPSGIAQIILLAICEVILILTLNAFRPFQGQTSMNAYHTFFSVVRLITILLSIAFAPTLGVTEASKGWIGYAILLLHACVLVFGFFLNSAQTLIEVIARNFGVGSDSQLGATRGSILNLRMLKKRENRMRGSRQPERLVHRESMASHSAMLQDADATSGYAVTRSRSVSTSSHQLLNRASGVGDFSSDGGYAGGGLASPNADEGSGPFPSLAGQKPKLTGESATETFYRPPRQRTRTFDALPPGAKSRDSAPGDLPYTDSPRRSSGGAKAEAHDVAGSFFPGRDSPAAAYFRDHADSNEHGAPRTDYAVREVDQYYRGQALSDLPRRTLKTGPADPEGPAVAAQSWFQKLAFGLGIGPKGKKDQSKGFEVVRSAPARILPEDKPGGTPGVHDDVELSGIQKPTQLGYQDSPELGRDEAQAVAGAERSFSPSTTKIDTRTAKSQFTPGTHPTQSFNFGIDGANDVYSDKSNAGRVSSTSPPADAGSNALMPPVLPRRNLSTRTTTTNASSNYDVDHTIDDDDDHLGTRFAGPPVLGQISSVADMDLRNAFNNSHTDVDLGSTAGGHAWLRQIDELEWDHNRRDSTDVPVSQARGGDVQHLQRSILTGSPPVPHRSSRRNPSMEGRFQLDVPPGQASRSAGNDFQGFDSVGVVSHRHAAGSISRNSLGIEAARQGQSAAQGTWGGDEGSVAEEHYGRAL